MGWEIQTIEDLCAEELNENAIKSEDLRHLYHGSAVAGIKKLNSSRVGILGPGIYLVPKKRWALRYAMRSSLFSIDACLQPTIYRVSLKPDLKIADLRKNYSNEYADLAFKLGYGGFIVTNERRNFEQILIFDPENVKIIEESSVVKSRLSNAVGKIWNYITR